MLSLFLEEGRKMINIKVFSIVFLVNLFLIGVFTDDTKVVKNINIADQRQLFLDRELIDQMKNVTLKLHEPVSGGVAIRIDKPWEGVANFGNSVIYHNDRYMMYYRGFSLKDKNDQNGVLCVAESKDGVTWSKPALNLQSKHEWLNNNIVVNDAKIPEFSFPSAPWVDTRPGIPASERIKLLQSQPINNEKHTAFNEPAGPKRLVIWGSADGYTFHKLKQQPDLIGNLRNSFDGGNTMFWSDAEQQYVLYYRWYEGEYGKGIRTVARTTSKDLLSWSKSVPMTYGDTTREQFYVNNTIPYFRSPQLYIALAARFMEKRQALSLEQAKSVGFKGVGQHRYDEDCSDGVLLTTKAGSTAYDRTYMESFVRPGLNASNWGSRSNYPLTGIFPCENNRIMFWVSRQYMQDSWHIEQMLLRVDGFASVNAPHAGGTLITKPFIFSGKELEINYRTGAAGFIRVGIMKAEGQVNPNFGHLDCPEIIGDEIDRVVTWKIGSDVSKFAGQMVQLRFELKDADLYSFKFQSKSKSSIK